ncbi:TPR-like protein [Pyrenochaeta sp. DS3sAY3a]|nr:TPR-like protein [Pyrenochaeta sp. DS3sAY3a]
MVEYIGAVAAIPQLAKYSYAAVTSIPDLKRRLRKAPDTLRHWQDDATLLISLTESLQARPDLVHQIPTDLLDRIDHDAKEFQNVLVQVSSSASNGRISHLKANIGILRKERQIRQALATISQRSSLISCQLLVHNLGSPTRSETLASHRGITQGSIIRPPTPRTLADIIAHYRVNDSVEDHGFIGQTGPLQELSEKLDISNMPVIALAGPRGIGKTHLIRQYLALRQTSSPQTSVYWIDTSHADAFASQQGAIQSQNLAGGSGTFGNQDIRTLLSWLNTEDSHSWLLIFDNVTLDFFHYRHLVEKLSQKPSGRILFATTSRTLAFRIVDPSCVLELSGMRPEDARGLLSNEIFPMNDTNEALELAQFLGCFPSPIAQVNAYMRATATSPSELLSVLHQDAEVLSSILEMRVESPVHHYISGASMNSNDKTDAILTLSALACLDYSCIDRQLIPHLAGTANKRKVFAELESGYFLLPNDSNSTWRMSDFHANLLKAHLVSSPQRLQVITNSLRMANHLVTTRARNIGGLSTDQRIHNGCCVLNNVMRFTTVGESSLDFISLAISLSIRVCEHLINAGNALEAVDLAQRFLAWGQFSLSAFNPSVHILHARLGIAFYSLALYDHSLSVTRSALYAQCRVSENNIDTLHTLNNMGLIHQAQNEFLKAEGYHRKTLELKQRMFETHHPEIFITLNNLGLALQSQQRFEEAEKLFRHVLRGRKRHLPASHADIFISMSNLGVVLQLQDRLDESQKLHESALAGRQRVLGPYHPETLKSKSNLALIFERQSQHDRAIETLHELCALYKQAIGPSHPETIKSLRNLAIFLHGQARLAEAEERIVEVLDILEERHGRGHPETFGTLQYLGLLLHLQGKLENAWSVVSLLYDRRKDTLGLEHQDTKCSLSHMKDLHQALGQIGSQYDFMIVP